MFWIIGIVAVVIAILYVADRKFITAAVKAVEWDLEVARARIRALEVSARSAFAANPPVLDPVTTPGPTVAVK